MREIEWNRVKKFHSLFYYETRWSGEGAPEEIGGWG